MNLESVNNEISSSSDVIYTKHASKRIQQRGIPPLIVEWLVLFGDSMYWDGFEVKFFDKSGRKRLRKYVGHSIFSSFDKYMKSYLMLGDDGVIVTVGHRTQRFKRK